MKSSSLVIRLDGEMNAVFGVVLLYISVYTDRMCLHTPVVGRTAVAHEALVTKSGLYSLLSRIACAAQVSPDSPHLKASAPPLVAAKHLDPRCSRIRRPRVWSRGSG